jgi:hypothetical protein
MAWVLILAVLFTLLDLALSASVSCYVNEDNIFLLRTARIKYKQFE